MADRDLSIALPATPPLGPGVSDPRSPAGVGAMEARPPLGPGDDDPRSPARATALPARPPLGPGDSAGENPDDAFHFLAPPAAGPGEVFTGPRHVVRVPKTKVSPTPPIEAPRSVNEE